MNSLIDMNINTGKIYIARSYARVDSLRDYDIYINNEKKGELRNGGVFPIELKVGTYDIELRIDWYRTKKITINIKTGDVIYLIGGSSLSKFKVTNIFRIFSKEKYIYLKVLEKNRQYISESEVIEKIYKTDFKEYTMEDGIKDLKLRSIIYGVIWLIISICALNKSYENNNVINIIISIVSGLVWGIMWYYINKPKYKLFNKKEI